MKVGDLVTIRKGFSREGAKCFVEAVLEEDTMQRGWGTRVSLYQVDGEYAGDYWENELIKIPESIKGEDIIKLIKKNIDKKGLVKDFTKVLTNLGKGK